MPITSRATLFITSALLFQSAASSGQSTLIDIASITADHEIVDFGTTLTNEVSRSTVVVSAGTSVPITITDIRIEGEIGVFGITPRFGVGFAETTQTGDSIEVRYQPTSPRSSTSVLVITAGIADSYINEFQRSTTTAHDRSLAALETDTMRVRIRTEAEVRARTRNFIERSARATDLVAEKARALDELRKGRFCSKCRRPASQIWSEDHVDFDRHLEKVSGTPEPATPQEIRAKALEYDEKIRQAEGDRDQAAIALDAARDTEASEKRALEVRRQAIEGDFTAAKERQRLMREASGSLRIDLIGRGRLRA